MLGLAGAFAAFGTASGGYQTLSSRGYVVGVHTKRSKGARRKHPCGVRRR